MFRLGLAISTLILVGCTGPAAFQTESTIARVASKRALDRGPAGLVETMVLIPIRGGALVPIPIMVMRGSDQSYIYALDTKMGSPLTTQSTREFELGDCVRLWHPPLAENTNPEYSFVAGTLEKSKDCK